MRYDKKICFVRNPSGPVYNEETGNYDEVEPHREWMACLISDMGEEMMNLLFGKVVSGAKTIALPGNVHTAYDYIEDDEGNRYQVELRQEARHDTIFQVRRMQ